MRVIINYIKAVGFSIVILLSFFLIDPFDYGYLAGYLLTFIIYTKKEFIQTNLDSEFLILFLFSIIYALFSFFIKDIYLQTILFYGLFPPAFYLLGKYLMTKAEGKNSYISMLFLIIGILYSTSALISVLINLQKGGFIQVERGIPMFWNGNSKSATLMAAYFTFNMCIPIILFIRQSSITIFTKSLLLLIYVLSLLCVFRLGSRTQVVITILTFLIGLIFIITKQSLSQNMKLFAILGIVGLVINIYIPLDLDADYLSTLGQRMQASENTGSAGGRTELWQKSFNNLLTKPLGWDLNEFGYSHNLWLDVARARGFIPFLFLILFSIKSFINTKKAILLNPKENAFNVILIVNTIAINLLFMVEPVTEGAFSIFIIFCLFQGVITKYLQYSKINLSN